MRQKEKEGDEREKTVREEIDREREREREGGEWRMRVKRGERESGRKERNVQLEERKEEIEREKRGIIERLQHAQQAHGSFVSHGRYSIGGVGHEETRPNYHGDLAGMKADRITLVWSILRR